MSGLVSGPKDLSSHTEYGPKGADVMWSGNEVPFWFAGIVNARERCLLAVTGKGIREEEGLFLACFPV